MTDTDSPMKWTEIRKKRKDVIENEIKFYSQFKMIVTDRYHGMIFALIANTPVIVLPSTDHKLSSGVKWFPTELYRNISFENSIDKICVLAKKVHNEEKDYTNPTFLYDEYFKEIDEYLKD